MKVSKFLVVPALLAAAACANTGATYQPIIDGPVGPNYQNDLASCQSLSTQQGVVDGNTGMTAATSAGVAAAGTAIIGNRGHNVRNAAVVGALAGVAGSALSNNQSRESIIANCMRGRGYRVVG